MINMIMVVVAFLLVLPILIYLPLKLSLRGKLFITLQCLAVAAGAIALFPYVPLWQNGLLVSLMLFMAGYFTVKYGAANWAIDSGVDLEEEHIEEFAVVEPPREEMEQHHEVPVPEEVDEEEEEFLETYELAEPAAASVKEEEDDYLESLFNDEQEEESLVGELSVPDEESRYLEELFGGLDDDDEDEDTDIPLLHFDEEEKP
jgi:hypothetical protein